MSTCATFRPKKIYKNSHIYLSNTNISKSQRLRLFVEYMGFSQKKFAEVTGIDRTQINRIWNDKQDVSKSIIEKVTKWQPDVSTEWLLAGTGEMLKSQNFDEKNENENEPLGADEGYFFPSNLALLIQRDEMLKNNLPSVIRTESQQSITALLEGRRRPSVAMLLRLRKALDVPLDALLLWDLREPKNMERLEDQTKSQKLEMEMAEMKAVLKAIMEQMETQKKEIEALKNQKEDTEINPK